MSGKEDIRTGQKKVSVTPLDPGWHHTEIVTERGSEKKHFTNEKTKKHYYIDK